MKKSNEYFRNAGQSASEVPKSQKHDANLQKNSTIYFQVGLILCLLATYGLFEMQFSNINHTLDTASIDDEIIEYTMDKYKIYEPEIKKVKEKKPVSKVIKDIIKEVPDDTPEPKLSELITQDQNVSDTPIAKIEDIPEPDDIPENIHVNAVEFVPIFPGCEKYNTNAERRKCLSDKVGKIVRKRFNTDIASEYGLTGIQRIDVQFKVNKTGNVTEVLTRSPHPGLDKEAKRVINKIPQMQPGKMGVTPVNVIYSLPIRFQVRD